jgi:hypothetical protein
LGLQLGQSDLISYVFILALSDKHGQQVEQLNYSNVPNDKCPGVQPFFLRWYAN